MNEFDKLGITNICGGTCLYDMLNIYFNDCQTIKTKKKILHSVNKYVDISKPPEQRESHMKTFPQ